jgi:hypothetical protein
VQFASTRGDQDRLSQLIHIEIITGASDRLG